jgi:hypothetical protein
VGLSGGGGALGKVSVVGKAMCVDKQVRTDVFLCVILLMAMMANSMAWKHSFGDVRPSGLVYRCRCFGGTCCSQLQSASTHGVCLRSYKYNHCCNSVGHCYM